ncbi:hypothetical protein F5144DRAFT_592025 [Chaetomium tenue]|uniref:Uncharacterized protein n=1 Tax=Chaetomium tenue TaxID=1854479 RepID=A0ACB7PJ37_9PEZI|nr:hypothetical protein F5144DRAFT_592025 [Chaetomium globosum]
MHKCCKLGQCFLFSVSRLLPGANIRWERGQPVGEKASASFTCWRDEARVAAEAPSKFVAQMVRRKPRRGAVKRRQEKGRFLQPHLWACIRVPGIPLATSRNPCKAWVSRAANDRCIRLSAIAKIAGSGQWLFTQPKGCSRQVDSAEAAHWQAEIRRLSQTTISSTVLDDRDTVVSTNSDSPPVSQGSASPCS